MTENWKPYLCNVNGKIASIFVDLGLRESVPIGSKPWLLWTWVHFQSPRADGPLWPVRFTEHSDTPVSRATSALLWPAFNRISTS